MSKAPLLAGSLEGRLAVVTGATSGIGRATVVALSERGAQVAALGRRVERLDELKQWPGVTPIEVDVTDAAAMDAVAEVVAGSLGSVDVVVACAGVLLQGRFEDADRADWDRMVDVNLRGVLNTVGAFRPALLRVPGGSECADLVIVSSLGARVRMRDFSVYQATKAATTALAEGWRVDLTARGVRVTNVEPGLVATELLVHARDEVVRQEMIDLAEEVGAIDARSVAELICFALEQPAGVNLPHVVIMPTGQV